MNAAQIQDLDASKYSKTISFWPLVQSEFVQGLTFAQAVVRDACEGEAADPDDDDTISISCADLEAMIERRLFDLARIPEPQTVT